MSIFVNDWAQDIFRVNRENYKIHFIWFKILLILLAMMSLSRVVLLISLKGHLPEFGLDYLRVCWMGLRFDALILGFAFLGTWAFGMLRFLFPNEITRHMVIHLTKQYYFLIWTLISLLGYFNIWFVLVHKRHMRLIDWQQAVELKTYLVAQNFPRETFLLITCASVLGFYLGAKHILSCADFFELSIEKKETRPRYVSKSETLRELYEIKKNLPEVTPYWLQFWFYLLVPLFIGAFCARGTVTKNHLEWQHSQISNSSLLNELVLNPVWTFDKRGD